MNNNYESSKNNFQVNLEILKLLTQNSSDVISVLAEDGTIKFQSSAVEKMTGYSANERLGKNAFDFLHPDDRERVLKEFKNRDQKTKKVEYRSTHKNGNWIWVESVGQNFLDNPVINGIIVNSRDISERKNTEQILKLRENYLTALNETSIILQKGDFNTQLQKFTETIGKVANASRTYIFKNYIDANGSLLMNQITEYTAPGIKPEIDNPLLQNLAYRDYFPRWEKILGQGNIINGKVADFPQSEKDVLLPQGIKEILVISIIVGKEFWGFIGFDNCTSETEWQAIEIEYLRASAEKISHRIEMKREQDLLENENKRFRSTMDSINAIIYVADMQTFELLFLNEYSRKTFGNNIGEKCYKVLHGLDKPCDFCANDKLLNKKGEPNEPYVWEFQNAINKKWYQCSDQAIQWTDGRLVRIEIATDITERKQSELDLVES